MKKLLMFFMAIALVSSSFAQNDYKKKPAIGVHFVLNDFQTASDVRSLGLANVIKSKQWHKTKRMAAGLAISYLQGWGSHVDFVGTLSGSFVDYPVPGKALRGSDDLLLEGAAMAHVKLLSDKYTLVPFLSGGLGASKYKGYYGAFLPVGLGLQFNVFDEAFVLLNSQYRVGISENTAYHFYHSIGVAGNIGKKKIAPPVVVAPPPPVVEPPKDRDGDGIVDAEDDCPDVAGLASLKGCPDKDGDGLTDAKDKCPDVAGLARYQGCPIPDTDKDGINDENDKCVTVPGVARYQGCPVPDGDGDGVNDEEDKCPTTPGPASNYGCPEISKAVIEKINFAAKNIFFATGSSKLLAKSFKSLNEVAKILNENPSYMLDIDGHTDNTGKADKNQILSENRATAVKTYLKSRGVDESKMTAAGHGQDEPVADNKTVAGRAKNRRVELKVRNY